MEKIKEAAKAIFAANPETKKLYGTTDGQLFLTQNHAQNHSAGLKNKTVTAYERNAQSKKK